MNSMGFFCLQRNYYSGKFSRSLVLTILTFFTFIFTLNNSFAQDCDYLPGTVSLNTSGPTNTAFYSTLFFITTIPNDSIIQVNLLPEFESLTKGVYSAYAVTFKTRDSISNLENGKKISDIHSACLNFSNPYIFTVCARPLLSNLETNDLTLCADGSKVSITDSIALHDTDGILDTFTIAVTISESPDISKDSIDVDLSPFINLSKDIDGATLYIRNINSPVQVQAILRAIYFYSYSLIRGNRTIAFQVLDGHAMSNILARDIVVFPLPEQPIQIFRKGHKNE